ncbi:MAG: secondary thiamine-phosphate synthase enzyme YjbQ [Candidatus Omnitrophota bacterium]|nr:secondary thiamine-phosphate synthase enzyme YjbQ [Candidatus Omnitrophota bacterium]
MIINIPITTKMRTEMIDITPVVEAALKRSKTNSGTCQIFVPHTTAGLTINENADPSVKRDILSGLEKAAPLDGNYEHSEGNSAAHIKSTIVGTDKTVFVEDGKLKLGTWQGIFFCEFDGPRQRGILVNITRNFIPPKADSELSL